MRTERPARAARAPGDRTAASPTVDPAVSLQGIWKAFGEVPVLRGLDLDAPRGSTVTVMGGSGSGKTVLLRLTAGLIKPDRGRIRVLGVDTTPLREEALLPLRRQMGFVFQGAALFDSLTTYENVAYPLREHTTLPESEVADRVHRLLTRVGLPDVDEKLPAELSGGMRKRVGIARALVLGPGARALRRADGGARPDERPAHHRPRREPQDRRRVGDGDRRDPRPRSSRAASRT